MPIEVAETATVGELRQAVQQKVQQQTVEPSTLVLANIQKGRLIYAGKILTDDSNQLGDVGVEDGHVVHLVKAPTTPDTSASSASSTATATAVAAQVPGGVGIPPIVVQQQQQQPQQQQQFAVRINLNPVVGGGGAQQISLTFPTATQVHVQTGADDAAPATAAPLIQGQTAPVLLPMPAPQVQVVPLQLPNGQVQLVPIAAPIAAQVLQQQMHQHQVQHQSHIHTADAAVTSQLAAAIRGAS